MTIILDLDDVLANLRESLYRTLSAETGIDLHWQDWAHYDLSRHYRLDDDVLGEVLVRERALESCDPEPDASAMTQALGELGLEVVIVTARGWHPRAEAVTGEWLAAHAIHYDRLRVVQLQSNKLDVIGAAEDIVLAVDDHPRHVDRYRSAGIPALVMDRPWNADCEAQRVYSMAAVVEHASRLAT